MDHYSVDPPYLCPDKLFYPRAHGVGLLQILGADHQSHLEEPVAAGVAALERPNLDHRRVGFSDRPHLG
jgi:hypothetical protein